MEKGLELYIKHEKTDYPKNELTTYIESNFTKKFVPAQKQLKNRKKKKKN